MVNSSSPNVNASTLHSYNYTPIGSSHHTAIRYKATSLYKMNGNNPFPCEEFSILINGETNCGFTVAQVLERLDEFNGRKAVLVVMMAFSDGKEVYIFEGRVSGHIKINPEYHNKYLFDAHFIPAGSDVSYCMSKPEHLDPYAIATEKFLNCRHDAILSSIHSWYDPPVIND